MKNLNFKKTVYLIKMMVAEQKKGFYFLPLLLACFFIIVGWSMNSQHLEQAISISTSSMIGIIFIHPVMIFLSSFVKGKTTSTKLLVPASALEKYVSFWVAGLSFSLLWLATMPLLMGMLWMIVGTSFYDVTTEEVNSLYMNSFHLSMFVVSLMCTAVFSLGMIVCQLKARLRYIIPVSFFCAIVGWIVLVAFLSENGEVASKMALLTIISLAMFIVVGSVTMSYIFFKKIQFNNH